jgi:hypothetical protein
VGGRVFLGAKRFRGSAAEGAVVEGQSKGEDGLADRGYPGERVTDVGEGGVVDA